MENKTHHIERNRELWQSFIKGDDNAFTQLYKLNVDDLFYYGLHFTPIEEIVKDAVQDVFVSIYSNRKNLKQVESVKLYLFVSLKNRLFAVFSKDKDYYRIDSIEPVFSIEDSVEEKYISREQQSETQRKIRKILQDLSPHQQEVIHYRFIEGMSYDEICELMKMNYQSVRNLLHRTIRKIRETSGEVHAQIENRTKGWNKHE
ncbi:MAG: sigma-70 family RNA polymerase sigma factor [Tannerellaceae bacterium]|nr:sigma-70 family RNA polymerase sigma factor [Tannerellaceae bacterium]